MSNLTSKDFHGCMTALVTPMFENGDVDYKQWQSLIEFQIRAKIKAIVVAGTTGESALLKTDEFKQLLSTAVKQCKGSQTLVIAQTGHICVDEVIKANAMAAKIGASAVLVVTPYYIRTTQEGLKQHFLTLAECSSLPIILYNVPGRTHNDMSAKTTAKLANHAKIIGIKEASEDRNRISEILHRVTQDFAVLSGNDDVFFDAMQAGACGVISVASNIRPHTMHEICNYMAFGDVISAKKLNSSLESLYKMLSCQPNPIPVKYLLHKAGLIRAGIRLPLIWYSTQMQGDKNELDLIADEIRQ